MNDTSHGDTVVFDPSVSLIRGGPFYRAQLKTRLIFPHQWNLGKRIIFAVTIGWLPLLVMTALFQPGAIVSLLTDYKVASRMLIAVPVLLLGQLIMESRFRIVVSQTREDLVAPPDWPRFDATIARFIRLRDSFLPEFVIATLAFLSVADLFIQKTGLSGSWAIQAAATSAEAHFTPAGLYFALVSRLIYAFLVGLNLWKWLLWTFFLFRLSRMNLRLMVSHPDKHAGAGFLGMSAMAFAPIAFAVTAAVGASWRYDILHEGAHIADFKLPAFALLVVVVLVALGPLAFFIPKLAALRRKGILEYGSLAHLHSSEFHEKWILKRKGHESEFLAAPEVSTLTDLASSFQNIEQMKPFLLNRGSLAALVFAVAIPVMPAVTAEIPLKVVLKGLLAAMK
jgi:hypothetical protein